MDMENEHAAYWKWTYELREETYGTLKKKLKEHWKWTYGTLEHWEWKHKTYIGIF
jgi:hypothetical protein